MKKAHDHGINFFDTARNYTDSEEKIGLSLSDVREGIVLATKSRGGTRDAVLSDLAKSLVNLRTERVDILQLHNLKTSMDPTNPESPYQGLVEARQRGMTRFIGMTTHRIDVALEAAASGLYDTVQFPLSMISGERDLGLIDACQRNDIGLIAMKALSGGLITNAAAAFAFLRQFGTVVPIWGIQRESELDEFIALEANPPSLDETMRGIIEQDRTELAGDFCRGCGYCLPCPAGIPIPSAARLSLLLKRTVAARYLTEEWRGKMARIPECQACGHCRQMCPYELDVPSILRKQLVRYKAFMDGRAEGTGSSGP